MNRENFVFYGSWCELLAGFPKETAKEILWQIMAVGTGNEMDTNDPMIRGIVNGAVLPNIEKAKTRYTAAVENGRKGGRPTKDIDMDQVITLYQQGKSYAEIADTVGVSRNTIGNRIREYKNQKPETETDKYLDIDMENYNDNRKVSAAFAAETQLKANSFCRSPFYGRTQEEIEKFNRLGF